MFNLKETIGDHKIYNYSIIKHPFIKYISSLFNNKPLDMLHLSSSDYNNVKEHLDMGHLNDRDTDLHAQFYKNCKSKDDFKKIYCSFIKSIHKHFFGDEEVILFQSFPSIRFQYMESVVIPPHYDSDYHSNHPVGEKNFIIPITKMMNTNTIYVETSPGKEDFRPINLNPGELFYFNGNKCTHYNVKNKENKLRISLDFRIILIKDYCKYVNSTPILSSNPRDIFKNRDPKLMCAGGYYQLTNIKESIVDMMIWYNNKLQIVQHRPTFDKNEADACYEYMLGDNFVTEYKKTTELENKLCQFIGCKYCIMTVNGTTAILLGLMSLDLDIGDEVIVPNYTMIATINAVKFLKLKPVIVDVDEDTFTLNIDSIKEKITSKTKCIIHVSLNNRSKNLNKLVNFCNSNNIELLEDAAQSIGCKLNDKSLGTFGKIGCFSLSTPKLISTGQGGFIVTDNEKLADKIRKIKNFVRACSGVDNFETFGMNFKFTDIQAVIGLEQLKKINKRVKRMREIYNIYYTNLKDYYEIKAPLDDAWFPWFVDILCDNREELVQFLKKHRVNTRLTYKEINKTEMYYTDKILSNSNKISNKGLFLPSFITITNAQILFVCKLMVIFKLNHE